MLARVAASAVLSLRHPAAGSSPATAEGSSPASAAGSSDGPAAGCAGNVPPIAAALPIAAAAVLLTAMAGSPLRAEPATRPPDLLVVQERTTVLGPETIGVYGRVPEPDQPGRWRVRVWRETLDRLSLGSDAIDCRPGNATRIASVERRVVLRTLNPGGLITPANRLDHLIWWATCFPEQAGRDPALLADEARRLGFDGQRPESLTVLPGTTAPQP